jgi:hypothetical protein
LVVYGTFCFVFAFVEPPDAFRSLFRSPRIFVFLPDRLVIPVGRVFVGVRSLIGAVACEPSLRTEAELNPMHMVEGSRAALQDGTTSSSG